MRGFLLISFRIPLPKIASSHAHASSQRQCFSAHENGSKSTEELVEKIIIVWFLERQWASLCIEGWWERGDWGEGGRGATLPLVIVVTLCMKVSVPRQKLMNPT
jgi:hypothetical protein